MAMISLSVVSMAYSAPAKFGGQGFLAEMVVRSSESTGNSAPYRVFANHLRQIRIESAGAGGEVVVANSDGVWTLYPKTQSFQRGADPFLLEQVSPYVGESVSSPNHPCHTDPNTKCTSLGNDQVRGIPTEKWELVFKDADFVQKTLLWVDLKRHEIIRSQFSSGYMIDRILQETVQIAGRPTEQWEIREGSPGEVVKTTKWVDAKLRVVVKMAIDDVVQVEVTKIREGKQPDTLFQIPNGWKETAVDPEDG